MVSIEGHIYPHAGYIDFSSTSVGLNLVNATQP